MLTFKDKILLFLDYLSDQAIFCPRRFIYEGFNSCEYSRVDRRLQALARDDKIVLEGRGKSGLVKLKVPISGFWRDEVFDLRRFKEKWPWDGLWRIVLFDIAEENRKVRNLIRRKLKNLGFAMFQKSVWVTPFDVAEDVVEFLKKAGLKGPVEVLEGRRLFVEDEKAMAGKLWHLEDINGEYHRLLDLKHFSFEDWLAVRVKDPTLPRELLPKTWYADEVEKKLGKMVNSETLNFTDDRL